MNDLLRSFGRALTGVLHPRMLWLTVAPFLIAAFGWGAAFWFGWDTLVAAASGWLSGASWISALDSMFAIVGFHSVHTVLGPVIVVALAIPLIVVTVLVLIATFAMPAVIAHLTRRHFPGLEARRGGSFAGSLAHSLVTTLVCLFALLVTVPLWLVPPLFALIPPLLWGWLTYRVMTYDALALHASAAERRAIFRAHRVPLFAIGVITGLLGAVPTLLWVSSALLIVLFPVIAVVSIWLYVFIFVFSAVWFAHYCLRALYQLRSSARDVPSRLPV
jgi:hypothetical protein